MQLYRIVHNDCGKEWFCTLEDARRWKCPICKRPLDNMKTATVGFPIRTDSGWKEFVDGEDLKC